MWEYTDKVKDHFMNPRNVGAMENPDAVGETGSLSCGDALRLFLKINNHGRITDASFMTFGCASAVASSSALTEMIKGLTLDQAAKITNEDIADYLDGLPKEKMHCSVMGKEALQKAIANYRGVQILEKPGNVVCECFGVTDLEIVSAVKENHLSSAEDVTCYLKAGGGCGKCVDRITEIVESVTARA
jgi:NifU-like protein